MWRNLFIEVQNEEEMQKYPQDVVPVRNFLLQCVKYDRMKYTSMVLKHFLLFTDCKRYNGPIERVPVVLLED